MVLKMLVKKRVTNRKGDSTKTLQNKYFCYIAFEINQNFERGGLVLSRPEWCLNKTMLGVVHGAVILRKQICYTGESWNVCRKDKKKRVTAFQ